MAGVKGRSEGWWLARAKAEGDATVLAGAPDDALELGAAMEQAIEARRRRGRAARRKGPRQEFKTMRLLAASGYVCCRSSGSLGCWDVIGVSGTDVVLVQVKSRDWPGAVEMELLRGFAVPPGVKRLIHRWRDGASRPDVREVL